MLIGEVSEKTGFTKDTIRWYEKIGLIKLNKKLRTENNYRNYDSEVLDRLFAIRKIKALGFTLKETEDLLILHAIDDLNCASVSDVFHTKIQLIDQKIAELKSLKSHLTLTKETCSGNCAAVLEI